MPALRQTDGRSLSLIDKLLSFCVNKIEYCSFLIYKQTMGLLKKIFNNAGNPGETVGRMLIRSMNSGSHQALATWALENLQRPARASMLDIGCSGGGDLARMLEKFPQGRVVGIDYSPVSVSVAAGYNKKNIAEGRCREMEANVEAMPFENETFDIVTAFETVYFWSQMGETLKKVRNVMKTGGVLMIANEADGEEKGFKWDNVVDGMHTYTTGELLLLLSDAGFGKTDVVRNTSRHHLCILAYK